MQADLLYLHTKKKTLNKEQLKGFHFVDLFAGIGGFHLALSCFDAKCVFASEWDSYASKVYENNFGMRPLGDITKINEGDIPKHNILCAGFPCQAFSISGKQKGFEDTRGTLFFDIARITKFHRPKILFLENVKNLTKHNKGHTMKVIKRTLLELGYTVHYKVLNASDYGLPQNRERVFIVCFRDDLGIKHFKFPKPSGEVVSLNDIIDIESKVKPIQRNDIVINKKYIPEEDLFENIDLPNKLIQIGVVNKGGQGERIYSTYGHACTLSAYGGGVGAKTGIYAINGSYRRLSPRECARVQGFPDSFKIDTNNSQAYKQFGNSVAVNVLKAIIKEIIEVI